MTLRASNHLQYQTWPRRGDSSEEPIEVWERALDLDVEHARHGRARVPDHDEARYDPETETVLFRREDTLTTVYSTRAEHVTNDHGYAVLEAVAVQYGADGGPI